jgi:3-oxoacyl-[acyl-carrier protein] reductase
MRKLEGKVAVVTGASKGIGASIAKHLAGEGAAVVVNYASSKQDADRVVDDIGRAGGKAVAVKADLSKPADIKRLFTEAKKAFGQLDILVNNAGIYEFSPLEEITEAHFHKQMDINVLGPLLASQEAVKQFGPGGGTIINLSSGVTRLTPANTAVYGASKAALEAITKTLAKELGPRNIRVNAIQPGGVDTEGVRAAGLTDNDFAKQLQAQTPLGRIGLPQDIAPVAVFLASADAAWITGETVLVSGGLGS